MTRALLTIAAVACLSGWLAHLEQAQGQRPMVSNWVRTADGWEPSGVLRVESRPATKDPLHPLLVASFQLGASLFALLAFPSRKPVAERSCPRVQRVRVTRRVVRAREVLLDA